MRFFNNPKFKNPYFWLSLIALIFSASGIDFYTLTSWKLLGDALLSIIKNPVSLLAVITASIGIFNDNSTPGLDRFDKKLDSNTISNIISNTAGNTASNTIDTTDTNIINFKESKK